MSSNFSLRNPFGHANSKLTDHALLSSNFATKPSKIPRISSPSSSILSDEIPATNLSKHKISGLPFCHSVDLIPDIKSIFKPFFKEFGIGLRITLEYPNPNYNERFFLVTAFTHFSGGTEPDTEEYAPVHDILETVSTVALLATEPADRERFGDENNGIFRKLLRAKNRKDGSSFLNAIWEYNALVREIRSRDGFRKNKLPRYEVLEHILYQCYARVVSPDAELLTNYRAFSNQVYGEVNYSLVERFIKLVGIDKDTLFIDMGCGIGNVVLQVAGRTGCKSVGIEIMELPVTLSKYQQLEFNARCEMYQLCRPKVSFVKGDFLVQPDILALLPKADVLLINNYVFDSNLNLKIMDLFLKLKDGCQIISLKSFAPLDVKVNSRNAGEPESIMRIKRYEYSSDSVSWTANPGHFYIHTIDRAPLRRFLENKCTS